jgi:hypothetical protein
MMGFLTDPTSGRTLQAIRREYIEAMAVDSEEDDQDDDETMTRRELQIPINAAEGELERSCKYSPSVRRRRSGFQEDGSDRDERHGPSHTCTCRRHWVRAWQVYKIHSEACGCRAGAAWYGISCII